MNAQEAYNKAQEINQNSIETIVEEITNQIRIAAAFGLYDIPITSKEYSKIKSYFESKGFRVSDWGDPRDSEDYRISWKNPKKDNI